MQVILWNTRKLAASKDFAGGYGVGRHPGGHGLRSNIIRWFYTRDRRPVGLLFAHLAAILQQLGHQVQYIEEQLVDGADLYIFYPSLLTAQLEKNIICRVLTRNPRAKVLVVGQVATIMPEFFEPLEVTVVKGDAEQLLWRFNEVLSQSNSVVQLGSLENLDSLPMPDWSPFQPHRFRISYDFWKFPTALIQSSRGCSFQCDYCPYIIPDNSVRFRSPEAVVDEMRHDIQHWGFRSFKFRDPLFGLKRQYAYQLAELIGRIPQKIQFSIETRIDLMPPELLQALQRSGLTAITVGIESPDDEQLKRYSRKPMKDDRQREFIDTCRRLGIRTVAGFMLGFPEDTKQSINRVADYAKSVNPTFANFNVVTPYPGTEFFERIRPRIADTDFSHYNVYTPVLKYDNLTADRVAELHAKCFHHFYFRWDYLRENAPLLWPILRKLGLGHQASATDSPKAEHEGVSIPLTPDAENGVLQRKGLRHDRPHRRGGQPQPNDRSKTQ